MAAPALSSLLPPALLTAIEKRGFTELTEVQRAVLDPACEARDLRITSQTGSGKTVAIGFCLRALVMQECPAQRGIARPRAIVVAPTRELAHQVEQELAWLYAATAARAATTTGGASYRDELRALSRGPSIVVGTPGRLLDHLERGSIDTSDVGAVVLDEADRMLDLGFRPELEAIFAKLPEARRTHLVSATFPRDVRALADRIQQEPVHVEGTRLGAANADIDHVIHIVEPGQRFDAIVNLLLSAPDAQTLIFVRMRSDATSVAQKLAALGFAASALSGEMDQAARNRALSSFRRAELKVLVATDVAARGIDVQDIARVIHVEPPTQADAYTHRSGRTGRAGRKGTSSLLVAPSGVVQATRLLRGLGGAHRFEPIPSAEELRRAADERILAELTVSEAAGAPAIEARALALARRLIANGDVEQTLARLLVRSAYAGITEPREIRNPNQAHDRGRARDRDRGWVAFRISIGQRQGAEPRRLLAIACRRGDIAGRDVGAIRVERSFSIIQIASEVADAFERSCAVHDKRDPGVRFERETSAANALPPTHERHTHAQSQPRRAAHPHRPERTKDRAGDRPPARRHRKKR